MNKKKILCLDVSTTTVGWSEFEIEETITNSIEQLRDCGWISLKGSKVVPSSWEKQRDEKQALSNNIFDFNDEHLFLKSKVVLDAIRELIRSGGRRYDAIFIERPFSALNGSAKTSADVIIKLACFNYFLRNSFYSSDEFLVERTALNTPTLTVDNIRKYAFPLLAKNKIKGKKKEEQKVIIFQEIKSLIDKHAVNFKSKFELKKDGVTFKDECLDMTDAICVGLAVCELFKDGIEVF